jgi:outer membrane protein assembly factor BamA
MFSEKKNKCMRAKVCFFALFLIVTSAESSDSKIRITGNRRIEKQTILDYIPMDAKALDGDDDDVIKALMATGFF